MILAPRQQKLLQIPYIPKIAQNSCGERHMSRAVNHSLQCAVHNLGSHLHSITQCCVEHLLNLSTILIVVGLEVLVLLLETSDDTESFQQVISHRRMFIK